MSKEEKRRELQSDAFHQLLEHNRVICNWATGVGKSRVAINFIDYMEMVENKRKVLLLVGETAHKKNWKTEFEETVGLQRAEELLSNIRMECYNSLGKCTETIWDLVVADEGHHLRSENRTGLLKELKTDRILILSATLSERGDGEALLRTLQEEYGDFVTLQYDTQDAIDDGVLPTPTINVIPLELWDKAEERYDNITEYLERKKREYLAAVHDNGFFAKSEEELEAMKARMLHAGGMRKQYLGHLKTRMAKKILQGFESKGLRYICFCANIDQVKELGGQNVINSKQTPKTNKQVIERFNAQEIDSLFAVGMLQEGVSLKNIQAGLIVQLDGKARPFIQRFGRVLRSSEPILDIIYVPDSRDEDYLYNALKDVKQEYVHGWNIQEYITRRGLFEIKQISDFTLVGPAASYAEIQRFRIPYLTEIQGMDFILHCNGMTHNYHQSIHGTFGGLMVDPQNGLIYTTIYASDNRTAFALRTSWKASLGLLMPLATAPDNFHKPIRLTLEPDGRFAKLTVTLAGQELRWAKVEIPKDDVPGEGSKRLNLINNLIERINAIYSLGKTATTNTKPSAPIISQQPAPTTRPIMQSKIQTKDTIQHNPQDTTDVLHFGERILTLMEKKDKPFPSPIRQYPVQAIPTQGTLPLWNQ